MNNLKPANNTAWRYANPFSDPLCIYDDTKEMFDP